MAKLFGEFLLEESIVTEDQVAESLVTQLSSMPSSPELIYRHQLLPNKHLIDILRCQQTTGRDFKSAAKFLGYWSEEIGNKILSLLTKIRKPLGQVLVDKGFLKVDALSHALEKYIEIYCSQEDAVVLRTSNSAISMHDTAKPQASQIQNIAVLDKTLISEFVAQYDGHIAPRLTQLVTDFTKNSTNLESLVPIMHLIESEYVGLRAAGEMLEAHKIHRIASDTLSLISRSLAVREKLESGALLDILKISGQIIAGLTTNLKLFQSEEMSDDDPNITDLISRFDKRKNLFNTLLEKTVA